MRRGGCWPLAQAKRGRQCALAWMGPTHAGESLAALRRTLPNVEWKVLASARSVLPSWMVQAIGQESARR